MHYNERQDTEFRCSRCNKLLAVRDSSNSKFQIKCLRCGEFNFVLNRADYLVFITDCKGRILYINNSIKRFSGYSIKEVMGKTPSIWGKQMSVKFYKKFWDNILNKKKAMSFVVTNRHKNGTFYKVKEEISPILNDKGEIDFFFAIQHLI